MRLPLLAGRVFNTPLLIEPSKAEAIVSVLIPHLTGEVEAPKARADVEGTDRKPYKLTRGGIALVPVMGTLVRRGSYLDALSGLQSYDAILGQVRTAARDEDVKGVLLQVDSPGGEVAGLFDLADEIAALNKIKPVYATADDSAFSAAYAIASSADRIFVTRSGGVGSVGVVAMHVDQSGADAKAGLVYTPVFAGAHKVDLNSHAPLSDDAKARLQAEVDRLYGMFTAHVASARGMPEAKVVATQAGLFFGPEGVKAGLADEVGTIDDAAAALAARIGSARSGTSRGRAAAGPVTRESSMEATALHEEPLQGAETVPATTTSAAETPASEPEVSVETAAAAPEAPATAETETPAPAAGTPVAPAPAAEAAPAPVAEAAPAIAEAVATVDLDAVRKEAAAEGEAKGEAKAAAAFAARATKIVELCATAGTPHLAGEMIASDKTLLAVSEDLLARKADASDASPVNALHGGGAVDEAMRAKNYGWGEVFAKAAPTPRKAG